MIDFSKVTKLVIPEGNVTQVASGDKTLWKQQSGDEYTLLNYIVVPSGAWFNTGIVPSADKWTYEAEMYAGTWGSNGYYYFAVRQTRDYDTMYSPFFVQSGWRMYLSGTKTASAGGAKNTWYTLKSEIEDGLQNLYINGTLKTTTNLAITTTYTLPLYLFGANFHGGKYSQTVIGRIKYLKATKGTELVRHLVAARRNADGECGLLELVTYEFLENKGSGTVTGVEAA